MRFRVSETLAHFRHPPPTVHVRHPPPTPSTARGGVHSRDASWTAVVSLASTPRVRGTPEESEAGHSTFSIDSVSFEWSGPTLHSRERRVGTVSRWDVEGSTRRAPPKPWVLGGPRTRHRSHIRGWTTERGAFRRCRSSDTRDSTTSNRRTRRCPGRSLGSRTTPAIPSLRPDTDPAPPRPPTQTGTPPPSRPRVPPRILRPPPPRTRDEKGKPKI